MTRSERSGWLAPTLILCLLWSIVTVAAVVWNMTMKPVLPGFIAKPLPFVVAGVVTGLLVDVSGNRRKIIAAAILALVAATAWTLFSLATTKLPAARVPLLFAASLPVHLLSGAWAYVGMSLGARRRDPERGSARDAELDELEREIKAEMRGGGG